MMSSLRSGLLTAALLAGCSIGVEQDDSGQGQDGECLQLFETCVELAGESPGCTEVFQFCQGSIDATGTGGGTMPGSCEQNYIECLAGGSTAEDCQPLLDACMPSGSGSTTGCDPLEPTCGMSGDAETSVGSDGETECPPDNPDCPGSDCDARYEDCLNTLNSEDACESMREACLVGDCESALATCSVYTRDPGTCSELTGCEGNERLSCDELAAECEAQRVPADECGSVYPEQADCFPDGQNGCEWYQDECQGTFESWFCLDAEQACVIGWLPESFECSLFFPDGCDPAGLSGSACDQVTESCNNGFFDAQNCAATPLSQDPIMWLSDFAECNEWL